MKICPTCRKTYADDGLNFCLDDGSVLTLAHENAPPTVMMNQPRYTEPNAPNQGIRTSYGDQAAYSMQPQKSSKAWLWVLGILGVLVLVCGGGFAGFLVYVASLQPNDNTNATPTPGRPVITPTPFPRDQVRNLDLKGWVRENSDFGDTSYTGGEFHMSSKRKGYYYVVAATDEYRTESASTSVTLRNLSGEGTDLGYGLVFHSDPKPLQKGYAFLIDTKRLRYRIARHEPGKEIDVVNWTSSNAIRPGSAENTLEARDTPQGVELYVNGQLVTSIKNTHGFRGGVVGLYAGDAIKVAFKRLEIAK